MPYWGSGSIDNDYAFDGVGVYILLIKERMFRDAENVIAKSYSLQKDGFLWKYNVVASALDQKGCPA